MQPARITPTITTACVPPTHFPCVFTSNTLLMDSCPYTSLRLYECMYI